MKIEHNCGDTDVEIHIDELLELYKKRVGRDYNYFCVMVRVEAERIRRKQSYDVTFARLSEQHTLFCSDQRMSANMCIEMLEIAGLSKKGQAKFRQHCRDIHDYEFEGNRVVDAQFSHLSIDEIEDVAVAENWAYPVVVPFVVRMKNQGSGDIRLGILLEIQKKRPDYVAHFSFNVNNNH